jgi:hypothetical protein
VKRRRAVETLFSFSIEHLPMVVEMISQTRA